MNRFKISSLHILSVNKWLFNFNLESYTNQSIFCYICSLFFFNFSHDPSAHTIKPKFTQKFKCMRMVNDICDHEIESIQLWFLPDLSSNENYFTCQFSNVWMVSNSTIAQFGRLFDFGLCVIFCLFAEKTSTINLLFYEILSKLSENPMSFKFKIKDL